MAFDIIGPYQWFPRKLCFNVLMTRSEVNFDLSIPCIIRFDISSTLYQYNT